ncbi:MAG: hypothetical protein RLZZ298_1147 [Pseudomonadota bacterium]
MTTHSSKTSLTWKAIAVFLILVSAKITCAGPTNLATKPMDKINAPPNIMFVLDDSGTMARDYLPDWAGPYKKPNTEIIERPLHLFANSDFNGIAYNPATRYRPPVMVKASPSSIEDLDTTKYPNQDGTSPTRGGDSAATVASPNWKAVKKDGYGAIWNDSVTASLEGQAFYYTTTAGEYCTTAQLRTCVAATTPAGLYTFPAKLRWCTTAAMATASTATSNGYCQAKNIDPATGITSYTYARIAGPQTAIITVNSELSVAGISVSGGQILSSATGTLINSEDVAVEIAKQINICTSAIPTSSNCTVTGYSATSSANVVTITAPGAISVNPVVSGGSTTITSGFASAPGTTTKTTITSAVNSYPKGANRTDCIAVSGVCNYVEEMTNYANWYAYYRTRMQMMKTSASFAFKSIDETRKVGYFSLNNGNDKTNLIRQDFRNIVKFNDANRYEWYKKFFEAYPNGETPLREALSNAGKIYARKLTTLYGVTITDPMEYSCQQNYTILSTDGYWNDNTNPTKLDGAEIGNQDYNDLRPYYDGSRFDRTTSQTTMAREQIGINTHLVETQTHQQQETRSRLSQSVLTTTTYPYQLVTTPLQTRTKRLTKNTYKLESRTYPLKSDTQNLVETTYKLISTPRILQSYINNLTKITTPLNRNVYNVTVTSQQVDRTATNLTVTSQQVDRTATNLTVTSQQVDRTATNLTVTSQQVDRTATNLTVTSQQVDRTATNLTVTTTPLQSSTIRYTKSERQLQIRYDYSNDGGDTWFDSGWQDATTTCVVGASVSGSRRNTLCRYNVAVDSNAQNNCTTQIASTGTTFSVLKAVTCTAEAAVFQSVASCNVISGSQTSPYAYSVSCGYTGTASPVSNQATCTPFNQGSVTANGATMSGNKVVCTYDASAQTPTTGGSGTCTVQDQAKALTKPTVPSVKCALSTTVAAGKKVVTPNQTSCTATVIPSGNNTTTTGSAWIPVTSCAYDASAQTPTTGGSGTCTVKTAVASPTVPKVNCALSTTLAAGKKVVTPNQTTCTATVIPSGSNTTANNSAWIPVTSCAYDASAQTPTTGGAGTCTVKTAVASPTVPKVNCALSTTLAAGKKVVTTNQTSCTATVIPSGNNTTANNSAWIPVTSCAYDSTLAASSATGVSSCTWIVPNPVASAPRTDCVYGTGVPSTESSCTPVAAQSTTTTNGTVWNGPTVTCAYAAAAQSGTNLNACTAGSPSATNNPLVTALAYTTCSYINGAPSLNQPSCAFVADSPGPTNYTGPANVCAYDTGAVTNSNAPACTVVAQSGTFAAPAKTCAYAAVVTATGLSSCTEAAQSPGPTNYSGPAVHCYYSTTSTDSLDAATCAPHRDTGSPYTLGAAVDCAYSGTATPATNQTSCTVVASDAPGPYTHGAKVTCDYNANWGTYTDVASGSCTANPVVATMGAGTYTTARECAYTGVSATTLADNTCTNAESTTSPYSILQKKVCTSGAYPGPTVPAVVSSPVDTCSTTPSSVSVNGVVTATATTCDYLAAVTTDVSACAVVAAPVSSPLVTSVSCPVAHSGWSPVAPTNCSPLGTMPSAFDGSGKIIECRDTDTTLYNSAYPSGPVPDDRCLAGTDTTTQVQTTCTPMAGSTSAIPVQNCSSGTTGAPDHIKTLCNTTTTTDAYIQACTEQASAAPLWQSVTCPYAGGGTTNTLSDVAAYYYKTDLRTTALNNCTGTAVPPATNGNDLCELNDVPITQGDPNPAQHMTTFTLGLGASGYMKYSDTYAKDTAGDFWTVKGGDGSFPPGNPQSPGILSDLASGVCAWQADATACNWPAPSSGMQTTIDDLWHAGVNGHGAYYSAVDTTTLANSIKKALDGVGTGTGAAAAPSISTPSLTPGDSYIFSSTYMPYEWTGELTRKLIDPFTGIISTTNDWSVQAKLDAKLASSRNIWTFDSSVTNKLKAFTAANFGSNAYFSSDYLKGTGSYALTQLNPLTQFKCDSVDICLSVTDQSDILGSATGVNLINFLRGDRTNEGELNDNTKFYRKRPHIFGDMVNAQAVYVSKPKYSYSDFRYPEFVESNRSRQAVIYAAANDGMLHAFAAKGGSTTEALVEAAADAKARSYLDPSSAALLAASTTATLAANAALAADTVVAQEMWAYIPSMVLPDLYRLADKKYTNKHHYFVDATPVIGDVCISDCNTESAIWKTILVGGLGRGGRGYYALDITDPNNPKALWEFTDSNLGFSYGNPQIGKIKKSNGTSVWAVLFTTGHNNIPFENFTTGDGVGRLYVRNAYTGAEEIPAISTGVGGATPSGLGEINAQVTNPGSDSTIEAVYGGDLLGNLWRFDVNDLIGASGYDAQLLAVLKDGSGTKTQPITSKPAIGLVDGYKVVYVGTGQYLAPEDASTTSTQTFYAIKDSRSSSTDSSVAIFDNPGGTGATRLSGGENSAGFVGQVQSSTTCIQAWADAGFCNLGQLVRSGTGNAVNMATQNGWYIDLIGDAERANTDPALGLGLLAFTTNAPTVDSCDLGGKSYLYFLDYRTGASIGGDGLIGVSLANQLASNVTLFTTKGGEVIAITGKADGTMVTSKLPQTNLSSPTRRTSWRELIRGN